MKRRARRWGRRWVDPLAKLLIPPAEVTPEPPRTIWVDCDECEGHGEHLVVTGLGAELVRPCESCGGAGQQPAATRWICEGTPTLPLEYTNWLVSVGLRPYQMAPPVVIDIDAHTITYGRDGRRLIHQYAVDPPFDAVATVHRPYTEGETS